MTRKVHLTLSVEIEDKKNLEKQAFYHGFDGNISAYIRAIAREEIKNEAIALIEEALNKLK